MSITKFCIVVVLGVIAVRNWENLPLAGAPYKKSMEADVAELEQRVEAKRTMISAMQRHVTQAPAIGSVVGTSACGAKIIVAGNGVDTLREQIAAAEKDLAADQEKLAKAHQKRRELPTQAES